MRTSLLLALPIASLAAACSEPSHGVNGTIDFVPTECGSGYCSFDDRLAVGATTDVYLDGVNNFSTAGLHLESGDSSIAAVISGTDDRVTLYGNQPGPVDLLAVDDTGYVVDWVTIGVAAPDALTVNVTGTADGPHSAPDVDDQYFVTPGARLSIDVSPEANGGALMGALRYTVVIDRDTANAIDAGDDIASGKFDLTAPAGDHVIEFDTATAYRIVRFSAN